jgi:hypothetical protein
MSAQASLSLLKGHLAHLEGNLLQGSMGRLNVTSHMRQLVTDDGVVNQTLTEGLSLESVLEGLLQTDAREARGLNDDASWWKTKTNNKEMLET